MSTIPAAASSAGPSVHGCNLATVTEQSQSRYITPLSIVPLQTTFRAAQCLWIEPAISPMQPVCRRCRCDIWALLRGTDPAAAQSQGRRDVVRAHRLSAAEVCSTCGHNAQSAFLFSKKGGFESLSVFNYQMSKSSRATSPGRSKRATSPGPSSGQKDSESRSIPRSPNTMSKV